MACTEYKSNIRSHGVLTFEKRDVCLAVTLMPLVSAGRVPFSIPFVILQDQTNILIVIGKSQVSCRCTYAAITINTRGMYLQHRGIVEVKILCIPHMSAFQFLHRH